MSAKKKKRILLIADHASNYIPKSLGNLGLNKNLFNTHIAYDLGVKELCIDLSKLLKSKYITGEYSRLIIDLNRDLLDPTSIPEIVDRKIIPKNVNLSENEKKIRISKVYNRYHYNIKRTIKSANCFSINTIADITDLNDKFKR